MIRTRSFWGQELDTETIAGFAEQLGIPFNDAYGYYKGQQAVRDNNKLTNDEKAIELQNLAYDFDRKLRGIETEQQIAIDFLKTMREKGFSEEEISAYKQMNGITDYDDPITQAELRIKQAEARIQEIEAGGEPPYNSKAYWERESLKAQVRADRAEYNTLYGNPATAIDQAQAESIFTDLGQSRWFSEPGKLQCGEGYNRITEGSGRAGSTYVEKMGLVTKRDNPMVGNGLVIPIGDADVGHIETILSVDEENRTIQTISWNRDLNGSMTIQSYNLDELQSGAKYGNNWGFTDSQLKPEFQKKLLAAGGSLGGQKTYSDGQRAIMDVMDINSLTSTDLKILKENGLTSEDLFGYVTNSKQTLDEDAKAKVQNVYDAIVALKSSPGLSGAVGAGWGTLPFLEGPPSGTPAADFIAKFNLLKDTLAMENLNQLKGALSDKDLEFLRNTATSLNLSNSEATFKQTLQALEDKYASLLSQGTDISSVDSLDSDLNLYQYGTEDPQSTLWDNLP